MTIGRLFHLAHLVADLDETDQLYDDLFACERYYRGYEPAAHREASLLVIADQCLEPIAPFDRAEDARTPLRRFKARFGNRFHSIAWYVDDVAPLVGHLLANDVRLVDIAGRPVTDPSQARGVWTHPADTGALLEFAPPGFAPDPRLDPGWTTAAWRAHPLQLLRTSHITVLFDRAEHGQRVYGDLLDGDLLHASTAGPVAHWYYAIGEDTVIDVAVPRDTSTPEGRDLAAAGNAVHGLTFTTGDLDSAVKFLADHGVGMTWHGDHDLHLDLPETHGLNVLLTDLQIPGDTRV